MPSSELCRPSFYWPVPTTGPWAGLLLVDKQISVLTLRFFSPCHSSCVPRSILGLSSIEPIFRTSSRSDKGIFCPTSGGPGTDVTSLRGHLREDGGMNIKGNEIGELYRGERSEEKSLVVPQTDEDR